MMDEDTRDFIIEGSIIFIGGVGVGLLIASFVGNC